MSEKKQDLLDLAMSIGDKEPEEITVGKHSLTLRRTHTGLQVAEWQTAERQRDLDISELVKKGKSLTEAEVIAAIGEREQEYITAVFKAICVDTTATAIKGAAATIAALPPQSRSAVMRRAGVIAGLVNEKGEALPFSWLSADRESSTTA